MVRLHLIRWHSWCFATIYHFAAEERLWLHNNFSLFQTGEELGHIDCQSAGKVKNVIVPDTMNLAFHLGQHFAADVQSIQLQP